MKRVHFMLISAVLIGITLFGVITFAESGIFTKEQKSIEKEYVDETVQQELSYTLKDNSSVNLKYKKTYLNQEAGYDGMFYSDVNNVEYVFDSKTKKLKSVTFLDSNLEMKTQEKVTENELKKMLRML